MHAIHTYTDEWASVRGCPKGSASDTGLAPGTLRLERPFRYRLARCSLLALYIYIYICIYTHAQLYKHVQQYWSPGTGVGSRQPAFAFLYMFYSRACRGTLLSCPCVTGGRGCLTRACHCASLCMFQKKKLIFSEVLILSVVTVSPNVSDTHIFLPVNQDASHVVVGIESLTDAYMYIHVCVYWACQRACFRFPPLDLNELCQFYCQNLDPWPV